MGTAFAYNPTVTYYISLELDMHGNKLLNQQIFYSVKDTDTNDYVFHNNLNNNDSNPDIYNIVFPVETFKFSASDQTQNGYNHHYKIYIYGINYNGSSGNSGYNMAIPIRIDVSGLSVKTFSDGSTVDPYCPTYSYNTKVSGNFAVKFMGQLGSSFSLLTNNTINPGGVHSKWGPCHVDDNPSPMQSVTFKSKLDLNYSINSLINPQAMVPYYNTLSVNANMWQ